MRFADDEIRLSTYPERGGGMQCGVPVGVRVTHVPTGISAVCDDYRQQFRNVRVAVKRLVFALEQQSMLVVRQGVEMASEGEGASPAEALIKRGRLGLANSPCDCAEQLALLADAMAATAQGMSWVAQYAEDVDSKMRAFLSQHAEEMDGAARLAESWANAIVRGDQQEQQNDSQNPPR